MIAVPVTGDIRIVVVGAPAYFAQHSEPRHPRELVEHECLNWHQTAEARPYRWELTDGDRDLAPAVPARLRSTDSAVNIRLARAGIGLAIVYEDQMREEMARRELVPVLQEVCEPFPGYYMYYPPSAGTPRRPAARSSTTCAARGNRRGRPGHDRWRAPTDRRVPTTPHSAVPARGTGADDPGTTWAPGASQQVGLRVSPLPLRVGPDDGHAAKCPTGLARRSRQAARR